MNLGAAAAPPLTRAKALAPLVEAMAPEIERQRRLPEALVDEMLDSRLFRLLVPREYGGEEVEPMVFAEVLEELARHDASTAWCLGQTGVAAMSAAYLTSESAHAIFDVHDTIVAWGSASPLPTAVHVDGGYRVSGSWSFASGGHHATVLGGHCVVSDVAEEPHEGDRSKAVPRTLLFPVAAATWSDVWDVVGLIGTASDTYSVHELFVGEQDSLVLNDPSERRINRQLYRMRLDHLYACGFASVALGIARAMLDDYLALAAEKTPRGYRTTLRLSAVVQSEIAELEARLRAARHYLFGTLEAAWSAAAAGELPIEHRMAIRLASTHAIREAKRVASDAYNAAGSSAIFRSAPFERRLRDMYAIAQHVQGRRTHFETVGRFLLGLEPDTAFGW